MHRLFSVAAAMTWAISPAWLSTILTIANREGAGPEAVAKELGRPLDNTRAVEMRGAVAVIPVTGPIFRRANAFSMVSGATSVQVLATDLNLAMDADEVEAIVLDIDSPGGEANGICEISNMIYAWRGRKPIVAYIGGTGASAAYWIASACDRIYVSPTADVGSIGVVKGVANPAADSAKSIEIVSSQSPNKRPNVATEEGRAVIQAEVDALADVFVSCVARNRGVSTKVVLDRFGGGACFIGAHAVEAGMADSVSCLEDVIASLSPTTTAAPDGARASAAAPASATTETPTMKSKIRPALASTLAAAEDEEEKKDAAEGEPEPDGDEAKAPAFGVGDAVMSGERPAEITEVRSGPHYAIVYTDEAGGESQWSSEDELAPADMADDAGEEDLAEDDESPAASRARALALEVRKLRAMLASKTTAETKRAHQGKVAELLSAAKAAKKITPASEPHLRTLASLLGGNAKAFAALSAFVGASPRSVPVAKEQPPRKDNVAAGLLTHEGKSWSELSMHEKHNLFANDPDLAQAMQSAAKASAG